MIEVTIKIDDEGAISVGAEPQEAQEAGGQPGGMQMMEGQQESYMKQVGSVDEALQVAAQLLKSQSQSPDQAKQSMMTGYNRAGNKPMGGMMR